MKQTENKPMNVASGFEQVATDLVGFYNFKEEGASKVIFFVPLDITLMDGNLKKDQPTALITARLTEDAIVVAGKEDDDSKELVKAKKGDIIGIWYKPGMRALANLAGAEVQMYQEGSKDTGMPTEMLLFKIAKKQGTQGGKLRIAEDRRDKSRDKKVFGITVGTNGTITAEDIANSPF